MPGYLGIPCRWILLFAVISLVVNVNYFLQSQWASSRFLFTKSDTKSDEPLFSAANRQQLPFSANWGSWLLPQYSFGLQSHVSEQGWNLLYNLGGYGPWVKRYYDVVDGGIAPPSGCQIEQVHMMSRHAERYPTKKAGSRMENTFQKLKKSKFDLKGDLSFIKSWKFFTSDSTRDFEQLTSTGPYAGVLEAFTTGLRLRTRYRHLFSSHKTNLWASDSKRVIETGKYFSAGFFGLPWTDHATLHVIPETAERGGDTLTPGDSCLKYTTDLEHGHDYGNNMLFKFRPTYLRKVAKRLKKQNPKIDLLDEDVWGMQEMCGFETIIRGKSKWCDIFTKDEWEHFEYARDLVHYYRGGPGNPYGKAMGWLWVNATKNLLVEGPDSGKLFFSFVHDGDIAPMLAALDLFPTSPNLPVDGSIPRNRKWRTSQTMPMGGRVILERLRCESSPSAYAKASKLYVRVNVNDGIVAMPQCNSGPGSSCPLDEFDAFVQERGVIAGDFREVCGLDKSAPSGITFLHQ